MLFLGTSAAELNPNPFCSCPVCVRARAMGQIPRKRSALLLDHRHLIDFGPDVMAASQMYNAPFMDLDHVFITHTHGDHLCFTNLNVLGHTDSRDGHTLHVHLSQAGYEYVMCYLESGSQFSKEAVGLMKLVEKGKVSFEPFAAGAETQVGDYSVFAVHSNHKGCGDGEYALNYRFTYADGRKLHYACDTGLYSPETLTLLQDSRIDCLVMEDTGGNYHYTDSSGHLSELLFIRQLQNMLRCRVIREDSVVYVTHINQRGTQNHQELQAWMQENAPVRVIVAHDGLTVPEF